MGWFSRVLRGGELQRARAAAREAQERTDTERARLERWAARAGAQAAAVGAATDARVQAARTAAAENDLAGFQKARERYELALAEIHRARSGIARAHPKEAALECLAEAKLAAAEIRDPDERCLEAGRIGELQAQAGGIEAARVTLEEMGEAPERLVVLRAIAVVLATLEGPEAACSVAEEIEAAEIEDEGSQGEARLSIVQALLLRGDSAGARQVAATLDEPALRAQAWRLIAASEARLGHLDEARSIARGIEAAKWRGAAWSDIAVALAEGGDLKSALETADKIEDPEARWSALVELAGQQAQAGNLQEAERLAGQIDDPHFLDDALAAIAVARARRGDLPGALEATERIEDGPCRMQTFVSLALARKAEGDGENAARLLQEAIATAEALYLPRQRGDGPPQQIPSWLPRFIVDSQARLGEFEAAEAATQLAGTERERADLLGHLAFVWVQRSGDPLALEGLLERHAGPLERLYLVRAGAAAFLSLAEQARSNPEGARGSPDP